MRRVLACLAIALLAIIGKCEMLRIADLGETVDVSIVDPDTNSVYVIEYSADLTNWSWCADRAAGSNGFKNGFFKSFQPAQFYRARRL